MRRTIPRSLPGTACLLLLALVAARSPWLPVLYAQSRPSPAASFHAQADAACARCHCDITRTYLATPHAQASGPALAKLIPGVFTQPASGVTYSVSEHDGAAWLSYSAPQNPALNGTHQLEHYLGSGHLGVTYLYTFDGYLFESPVAYYTHLARYDMKPGLATLSEGAPAIPIDSGCLRCHMSGVVPADAGTLNHYAGAAFQHGGIGCESCHGDSSAHVRSGGRATVVNPAKLTAQRRDSVCISCHLEGDVSVEKNHLSALDYRPGDDIAQYLHFFIYDHAGANARGVSEVEQFAASRCKRASGDSMSCTSCHDPHFVPAAADRVQYYRASCLNCHGVGTPGITFAATHHPESPDCTSCHMPRSTAENIPHVAWTDHRILAHPDATPDPTPNAAADFSRLIPIFSPTTTPRDLALALYAAVLDGHTEDGTESYALLTQVLPASGDDIQVLDALGTLANMKGDSVRAGRLYAAVLVLDPRNRFAATNLAVLEAQNHNLVQARALLQPVFDRNQDLPSVAENLAAIDCLSGDAAAARSTLAQALRFSPGSHDLRERLQQVGTCGPRGDR
jgi:predicted CXXCH cytochrome family protein